MLAVHAGHGGRGVEDALPSRVCLMRRGRGVKAGGLARLRHFEELQLSSLLLGQRRFGEEAAGDLLASGHGRPRGEGGHAALRCRIEDVTDAEAGVGRLGDVLLLPASLLQRGHGGGRGSEGAMEAVHVRHAVGSDHRQGLPQLFFHIRVLDPRLQLEGLEGGAVPPEAPMVLSAGSARPVLAVDGDGESHAIHGHLHRGRMLGQVHYAAHHTRRHLWFSVSVFFFFFPRALLLLLFQSFLDKTHPSIFTVLEGSIHTERRLACGFALRRPLSMTDQKLTGMNCTCL